MSRPCLSAGCWGRTRVRWSTSSWNARRLASPTDRWEKCCGVKHPRSTATHSGVWSQIPSLLSPIAAATRLTGLQHTSTLPAEARPGRQALLVERGAAMQGRSKEGETK